MLFNAKSSPHGKTKAVKAGCKVIALERTDTVAGMTTDDIAALKGVLKQYE